jgi:hypothetical protein
MQHYTILFSKERVAQAIASGVIESDTADQLAEILCKHYTTIAARRGYQFLDEATKQMFSELVDHLQTVEATGS